MTAFDKHLTMLHQWARRDRRFAIMQAHRDEAAYPGIVDRLRYRLAVEREFAKPSAPLLPPDDRLCDMGMVWREVATW